MKKLMTFLQRPLKWLGILLAVHIVGMILYGMLLANTTYDMAFDFPDDLSTPNLLTWVFGGTITVAFVLMLQRFDSLPQTTKSEIRKAHREGSFSPLSFWKQHYLAELLTATVLCFLLQLPFMGFFGKYGFSFMETTLIERFYVIDAGPYLVTGSALTGLLISTLWLTLWLFAVRLLSILLTAHGED